MRSNNTYHAMEQKKLPHYKFMLTANVKGAYAIRVIVKDVEYIAEPYQIFNTIYSKKNTSFFT